MTQVDSTDAISQGASNLVVWFARHWLAIFNTMWGIYVFLPFLAPILMAAGLTAPARLIYGVYSIFCHQLPDHSYFLHSHTHELAPSAASLAAGGAAVSSFLSGCSSNSSWTWSGRNWVDQSASGMRL